MASLCSLCLSTKLFSLFLVQFSSPKWDYVNIMTIVKSLFVCLVVYLSLSLSVCVCLCVYVSVYLSVCVSVYLCVFVSELATGPYLVLAILIHIGLEKFIELLITGNCASGSGSSCLRSQ